MSKRLNNDKYNQPKYRRAKGSSSRISKHPHHRLYTRNIYKTMVKNEIRYSDP